MYVSLHRVKISLSKNALLCQAVGKEKNHSSSSKSLWYFDACVDKLKQVFLIFLQLSKIIAYVEINLILISLRKTWKMNKIYYYELINQMFLFYELK